MLPALAPKIVTINTPEKSNQSWINQYSFKAYIEVLYISIIEKLKCKHICTNYFKTNVVYPIAKKSSYNKKGELICYLDKTTILQNSQNNDAYFISNIYFSAL